MMKKAFTLVEINLAVGILSVGVLAIIGLYTLAYRENRHSREDVAAAAYADAVMGPLVTALSSTNVSWSAFRKLESQPGGINGCGWREYYADPEEGIVGDQSMIATKAQGAYSAVIDALKIPGFSNRWPVTRDGELIPALVVMHDRDDAVVTIAFRAAARASMLMSSPLYFTVVRFQGVVDEEAEEEE